jgi:hypothetical protein
MPAKPSEFEDLRSQFGTSKGSGGRRYSQSNDSVAMLASQNRSARGDLGASAPRSISSGMATNPTKYRRLRSASGIPISPTTIHPNRRHPIARTSTAATSSNAAIAPTTATIATPDAGSIASSFVPLVTIPLY